jgi:CheY-like chemotaxis protein
VATILTVDDSPEMRQLLSLALRRSGYHVATAGDGREALEQLTHTRPDLVITDIHMPVMDGLQLIQQVRARFGPSLPIVVISGEASPAQRQAALQLGANEFVRKPFVLASLRSSIEELLGDRNGTARTSEQNHGDLHLRLRPAGAGQGA